MTLTYNTLNGTNTITTDTALQMLLSLVDVPYINTNLMNDDVLMSINYLVEDISYKVEKTDTELIYNYIINDGSAIVRVKSYETCIVTSLITDSTLIARIIKC